MPSRQNESELRRNLQQLKALETSQALAEKVLKSYPDYGKVSPEYTAAMVEAFAAFSAEIQQGLANVVHGLRGRHAFLPTVADVVKLGNEIAAKLPRKVSVQAPEPDVKATADISRKLENLSRSMKNMRSVEDAERVGSEQDKWNEYLAYLGDGSIAKGAAVMLERGETEPPLGWERKTGWQGEIA